jgi:DNA-binding MarR family transcriptional regulator
MNSKQREEELTLQVLEAIDARSDVTQRHLAGQMGVALGLANSYLKRCVRKGLVKIQQAPANRYLYYLTPRGFAEKSRLTADYLSYSFSFYRTASSSCRESLRGFRAAGFERLGLFGDSELAEIATLQAMQLGIQPVCVVAVTPRGEGFLGIDVVTSIDQAPQVDAWLVTTLSESAAAYAELGARVGADRVFVPAVLGIDTALGRSGGLDPAPDTALRREGAADDGSSTGTGIHNLE